MSVGAEDRQSFWTINRIGDETLTPRSFNETLPFSTQVPYRLTRRDVFSSDDVPLHYASSLEVVLYENVTGVIVVDDQHLRISGTCVEVVPPNVVHGGWVRGERGRIFCLQMSLDALSHYVNIENFLTEQGRRLEDAPPVIPESERIAGLIDDLFKSDDNVYQRIAAILSIVEAIARHIPPSEGARERLAGGRAELKALISWTHKNYPQKITLDDAAAIAGFSKHYFCKWFKSQTGVNYIQYVKRVRVYNASKLLLMGQSVNEAGYESGFENMSYFIKCFKDIRGSTPKAYMESVRRTSAGQ
ncbi:MAG: helix-turn-helix transcriptional regulator [Clostridiales bacterium]|nr:helix-turn-helix transcriptional regulator [Clostridiales bacterium]